MKNEQASINRLWSRLLLESLARHGVTDVCIAPGSRSTPLTLEAQANPQFQIHTHFDERGLGFLGLGIAKASQRRVALIVTSGTAVANLLPALAEAKLTGEKLVVLSADRPQELVNVGANQAIEQRGIFSSHVSAELTLPSPSLAHSAAWLVGSIDALLSRQQHGGVHINCPFPEPLYGSGDTDFSAYLAPIKSWLASRDTYDNYVLPTAAAPVPASWLEYQKAKGVIIVGQVPQGLLSEVQVLARRLGWPLLADPQSGGSSAWSGYDVWLNNPDCHDHLSQATFVLQLGARFISKRLGQWLETFKGEHWIVEQSMSRLQPQHGSHTRICAPIGDWLAEATAVVEAGENADWAAELAALPEPWQPAPQLVTESTQCESPSVGMSELDIAANILTWMPEGSDLFLGNSLVVRLIDMLARDWRANVYTNRGASGIDGLVATLCGVQASRQQPMLAMLGDTSLLYDLNSLALLAQSSAPLVLVVINNDGGGIFDMLPVPEEQKEALYRMPHGLSFEHAAAMFSLHYAAPTSLSALQSSIEEAFCQGGVTLIEAKTASGEAGQLLKAMMAEVKSGTLLN